MGRTKKIIYFAVLIICLAAVLVALLYIFPYYSRLARSEKLADELRDRIEVIKIPEDEPEQQVPEQSADSTQEVEVVTDEHLLRVFDFASMQEDVNEDIYAWLYIPNTKVDYPIVQHPTDDIYYLEHTIEGVKGYPGSIYTEKVNSKYFTDFHTVIYGHNMKNGTMFHNLRNYKDETFFKENRNIYVYLPDRTLKYEIYAAYTYDDRHLMYAFDYTIEDVREGYLEDILNMKSSDAVIDRNADVTADSRIITLSTCVGGQDTKRFLVQAVLVEEVMLEDIVTEVG